MAKKTPAKTTREKLIGKKIVPLKPKGGHVFGRPRPSTVVGGFSLHQEPKRDTHFRELPPPTGRAPYQLDLKSIIPTGGLRQHRREEEADVPLERQYGRHAPAARCEGDGGRR